jgi:hypothetical protein
LVFFFFAFTGDSSAAVDLSFFDFKFDSAIFYFGTLSFETCGVLLLSFFFST